MIAEVDLSPMIPAPLMAQPAALSRAIVDIAEGARTEIVRLAAAKLGTTNDQYVQGVQPVKYHYPSGRIPPGERVVATIALVGWLPNAIENGWAGGDMKPALLRGRSARPAKDGGMYAVVPFRHGMPKGDASNRNFQKMGSAHARTGAMTRDAAHEMGRRIHSVAKRLRPPSGEGHTRGAKRLSERKAFERGSGLLRPHHTTSIHTGMVRQVKTYSKTSQSQYRTFRAVSKNSRSEAWVHPGIEPHQFFKQASAYTGKLAGFLLQQAADGLHRGSQ
jgi:hypothetical protein